MPPTVIAQETGTAAVRTMAPVQQPIAILANVTKRYGATIALDGLSLALRPGEVVALLGPNGAGKSTAVRLLLGLIAPNTGTARVFEHIDLFRSYYPRPLPAEEIVRIAQLDGIYNRFFSQLSGGQKQRVLFGLALCGDPDLIVLDEPTVGMDIEARRGLWQQIRNLVERGKTVLLTTHYLEEADALAHRIVVINEGKVVSEGTPSEIKNSGAGRRISCFTRLTAEYLRTLPGVARVECDRDTVVVTASEVESVVREMLLQDAALSNLEIASPALEDAFLALTSSR